MSGGRCEHLGNTRTLRVGTDLCSVSEVSASLEMFGDRYLKRIYTEQEIAYAKSGPAVQGERLAGRFAAKEATLKALRSSTPRPQWRDIEVVRHADGWCELSLTGSAAELARLRGVHSFALSLSHDSGVATAVVVAECSRGKGACDNE